MDILFTLLAIAIQGIFALFEMAVLSIHQIRLQYEASLGKKRALWLKSLLAHPSRLFGMTLVGINSALLIGAEFSRKVYESFHIDPDLAPLSQVLLVIVFGELAPMFSARKYPSQIALGLAPIMMVLSRLFIPFTWSFTILHQWIRKWTKTSDLSPFFSREEIALAFRERTESEDELNQLTTQIFHLKNATAEQMMTPLELAAFAPVSATAEEIRKTLPAESILLYRHSPQNIAGILHPRDLLRMKSQEKVFAYAKSPWFVTKESSILEIINQFRKNKQNLAVILNSSGQACGILSLDQIIELIFGKNPSLTLPEKARIHVERTLSADMTVEEFNREFQVALKASKEETLEDLILATCKHVPTIGETVQIGRFSFTVLESSLRGVKTVNVRSL